MKDNSTSKKMDRRRFLLQAAGGTLAVGFGAGLTSCSSTGGGSGLKFKGVTGGVSYKMGPAGPEWSATLSASLGWGGGNGNNNSAELSATYDEISDTWAVENVSEDNVLIGTYDLEEYDESPVEWSNLQIVLAPGQSFLMMGTSSNSWVITNSSTSDIDLGGGLYLGPNQTLDADQF